MQNFRVLLGTYEKVLIGLDAEWKNDSLSLDMTIAYASHIGTIKTVAVGGPLLASGSTDEVIKLYDVKRRKELGTIHSHQGTIQSLKFHGKSHLISASSDGTIQLYRTKDFELLKTLKGHKSPINDVAIHPSGALAISIGASDKTAMLWDLTKGSCAATTRNRLGAELELAEMTVRQRRSMERIISQHPDKVIWNKEGTRYAILFTDRVEITDLKSAKEVGTLVCYATSFEEKMLDFCYHSIDEEEYLITACEDGQVRFWSQAGKSMKCVNVAKAHDCRIKAVSSFDQYLVTATSAGDVSVWNVNDLLTQKDAEALASACVESRITCMAIQTEDLEPQKRKVKESARSSKKLKQ